MGMVCAFTVLLGFGNLVHQWRSTFAVQSCSGFFEGKQGHICFWRVDLLPVDKVIASLHANLPPSQFLLSLAFWICWCEISVSPLLQTNDINSRESMRFGWFFALFKTWPWCIPVVLAAHYLQQKPCINTAGQPTKTGHSKHNNRAFFHWKLNMVMENYSLHESITKVHVVTYVVSVIYWAKKK